MEIEFHGKLKKAELFQAIALLHKSSRRGMIIRASILAVLVVIYIAYFFIVAAKENPSAFDITRAGRHVIFLGIFLYWFLHPYISAYRVTSSLWKIPAVQAPFGGLVSGLGISLFFANGHKEIPWDQFTKIRKNNTLIALLNPDGTLTLLSRSFFKSEND